MNLEPEQEQCSNCRWSRQIPEQHVEWFREWFYEKVINKEYEGKELEKRALLDDLYGLVNWNCMAQHMFVGDMYCCDKWAPKQQWFKVRPEDMQLIGNLLEK